VGVEDVGFLAVGFFEGFFEGLEEAREEEEGDEDGDSVGWRLFLLWTGALVRVGT